MLPAAAETLTGCSISSIEGPATGAKPELPCVSGPEQAEFVRRFVDQKLADWQKQLKLDGWNVTVVMARRAELKP